MGAWGPDAFANDAALDAAPELVSEEDVIYALDKFLVAEKQNRDPLGLIEPAYAAAEIVAIVRAGNGHEWQSEGTTLFADGGGMPYIPEEVSAFVTSGATFSDVVAESAIRVVELLAANPEREGWHEPEERREALAATKARLLQVPARPWSEVEPGARVRLSSMAEITPASD